MSAHLPRLAAWIVEHTLPADVDERDAVLGDLAEEFAAIEARAGRRAAARWYRRQVAASALPNLKRRLHGRSAGRPPTSEGGSMESLAQDLRYALRTLGRRPALVTVALASLTIGISLPAVVFSLVNAVLLRPLPVRDPGRLAILLEQRKDGVNHNFSHPDFASLRDRVRAFEGLTAHAAEEVTLGGDEGSRMIVAELVSGSFFELLGVRMLSGRPLTPADDQHGSAPVAVISEGLARERAGAAGVPASIVVNRQRFTVVGVAAAPFRGAVVGRDAQVWLPLHAYGLVAPTGGRDILALRTVSWLTLMARLRGDATREAAAAELNGVEVALATEIGRPAPRTFVLARGRQGDAMLPSFAGPTLTLLLGAAALVLLVACANVANLLLARAAERGREMSVRAALGAGAGRLARLVFLEALVLAALGTAAGVLVARWGTALAVPLITLFGEAVAVDVSLDWRMVAFVAAMVALTALSTGLAPVLHARRPPAPPESARTVSAGRASIRARQALVVAQFALSLALVAGAALLVRTVVNLRSLSTGMDVDRVALLAVDPAAARLDSARTQAYVASAVGALTSQPGVAAAAFARVEPLGFGGSRTSIVVPGYQPAADEDMEINFNSVSAGYFATLGIAIVDGRGFDERDRADGAPVMVVNETMAARYWPGARAIGRTVVLDPRTPPAEVIGVARDVKYRMLRETAGPSFYLPLEQAPARRGVLHVRVPGDPTEQLPALRRALAAVDPNVPIGNVRTLRTQADRNMNDERVAMLIAFVLGGAALLLAAVGLYGAMAYAVGQRARELAVRVALGARAGDIRRLILSQGLMVSILGAAIGSGLAVIVGRAIESRLFGVRPGDALTIAGAAGVMVLVALAASWVPARRACRMDPIETLRIE